MMHVAMMSELNEGMAKMKYCVNHSYRFRHGPLAFLVGLAQVFSVVLITLLNYYVIIARSNEVIDVVKDFLAMMVITEFDNFFYQEHSSDHMCKHVI